MDSGRKRSKYTSLWKRAKRRCQHQPENVVSLSSERPAVPPVATVINPQQAQPTAFEQTQLTTFQHPCITFDQGQPTAIEQAHQSYTFERENSSPVGAQISDYELEEEYSQNDRQDTLQQFLQGWAVKHSIHLNSLDDLLSGLKRHGHPELPKTGRTLLRTSRSVDIKTVSNMQYIHFCMQKEIKKRLTNYPEGVIAQLTSLELSLNIDGLPLFKSSNSTLWPVLCAIHLEPAVIFPVTLTLGPSKPQDLMFLDEMVSELADIIKNGIEFQGKNISVHLRCVVCDAPAKAMVKRIQYHTGRSGCDKCATKGVWIGRMTFQEIENLPLWTDMSYRRTMKQLEENGNTPSPFCRLSIDMVSQFPIDYMHQCCFGVMKKLMVTWVRGDGVFRKHRLSVGQKEVINSRLGGLKKAVPKCFARKPRGIDQVDRWKATEFRHFAVYTGKLVLKGVLDDRHYQNFLYFSVALSILLCPNLATSYNQLAEDLLKRFVGDCKQLYRPEFLVYNVHMMVHLAAEAKQYGSLDACSAFPFENYMQKLKRMVRSGKNPLLQITKRLGEIENQSQVLTIQASSVKLKRPNNAYVLDDNSCCEVIETSPDQAENGEPVYICRIFSQTAPFFTSPCNSKLIGCFKSQASRNICKIPRRRLNRRAILVERAQNKYVFMAILHEL